MPLLALTAWLRYEALGKPVWQDEVQSQLSAERFSFASSPKAWLQPTVPAARLSSALTTTGSLRWVRAPYLAFGLLGIFIGWLWGRLWGDWLLAVLLALALTLWPFKAYWDTMIRDYALLLTMGMACLYVWERFRLRRRFAWAVAGLLLTLMGTLTHESGWALWAAAGIYVAWDVARGSMPWARGLVRRRAEIAAATEETPASTPPMPADRGHPLRAASLALLFVLFFYATAALQFGPGQVNRFIFGFGRTPAGATAAAAEAMPTAPATTQMLPPARPPTPGQARTYLSEAWRDGRPARLLGLPRIDDPAFVYDRWIYSRLILGPKIRPDQVNLHANATLNLWMWLGLAFGSLALAMRSPPLLLSLWSILILNGLIVQANLHRTLQMDRYYSLAALAWLLLLVFGLGALLGWLRWPLRRWRPRLGAWATLILALGIGCGAWALATPQTRLAAGFHEEDWGAFYRQMSHRYHRGALFVGYGAKMIEFERKMAMARGEDGTPPRRVALRQRVIEAYNAPFDAPEQIYDRLNGYDGVVFFRRERMREEFNPMQRDRERFEFRNYVDDTVRAVHTKLGNRVFAMRGRATVPVLPEMWRGEPPATAMRCEVACCFETPGRYELLAPADEDTAVSAIRVDGRAVESRRVFPTTATQAVRAEFFVPPPSGTATLGEVALEIDFARRDGATTPVLQLRRIDERWRRATSDYVVGGPLVGEDEAAFSVGLPVRLSLDATRPLLARLLLFERAQPTRPLAQADVVVAAAGRGLRADDSVWCGPLRLEKTMLRDWVEKDLMLILLPAISVSGDNARAAAAQSDAVAPFIACYLRPVVQGDTMLLAIGEAK